jgi:tetratricopeptide (TPR) repeat protein
MKEIFEKYGRNERLSPDETGRMNAFIQSEKAHLRQLRKSHQRLRIVKRTLAVAASVLLLGLVRNSFPQLTTPQYDQLAMTYLAEFEDYGGNRMDVHQIEQHEMEAKKAYQAHQFDKAAEHFQKLAEIGTPNLEHRYFWSICLVNLPKPNYDLAIQQLLKIREVSKSWQETNVAWRLGLCYIKTKQLDKAKMELKQIEPIYRTQSIRELLKLLENS